MTIHKTPNYTDSHFLLDLSLIQENPKMTIGHIFIHNARRTIKHCNIPTETV